MSTSKNVYVRNHKKRLYNGIWYMQIVEIPRTYLTQYLISWFLEFNPDTGKSNSPDIEEKVETPQEHNIDDAKAYLEKHNIRFAKNMKDENIIKRAIENGWKTWEQSPDIDDTDLSALDEDDSQDEEDQLDSLRN